MEKMTPADLFAVYNRQVLNDNDRNILTLLYQPIIGADAINLYMLFWSLLKGLIVSKEKTHHYLMAMMHFDLAKIIQAREKLEAIGLLKSFYKKDSVNYYVYELYAPLMPNEFLKNPLLSSSLKKNIGNLEFDKVRELFVNDKIDLSDYQDISKRFSDIFAVNSDEEVSGKYLTRETNDLQIDYAIDVEKLLSFINEDIINHKLITKEEKEQLQKIAYVYGLDENILRELIVSTANQYKKIDLIKLRKKSENFYQYDNEGRLPGLAYKNQPENLRKDTKQISKRNQMIYFFETTSPRDYLFLKNGKSAISQNEKKILAYLLIDLKLKPGVVNVLIDYVLKINNNKLVKNFVETIALQWKRAKVETVEDAMKIAESEWKSRKKILKKEIKKENLPDWFNQETEAKKAGGDSKEKISELLKEYR